jgi:deoxyribodipyrimidine photo-lyase
MTNFHASPVILWFRGDLRLDDHPGVAAALATGRPILPLYIWDENAGARDRPRAMGGASRWWLRRSLEALDEDLRRRGSRLIIAFGSGEVILGHFAQEYDAKTIYCSHDFDPASEAYLDGLRHHLSDQHIRFEIANATLLGVPSQLKTKSNQPYRVFTPFARAMVDSGLASVDKLPANADRPWPAPETWPNTLPIKALPLESRTRSGADWAAGFSAFTPGARGAKIALRRFIEHALQGYAEDRDRPDRYGTSRLSAHLRFGEISPQRVLYEVEDAARHDPSLRTGAARFRAELLWREFCYDLLAQQPRLHTVNFRRDFDDFPWRDDEQGFRAWTRGETGYPLVDAGMRQLWRTGWMHNRVRMVAASFLVKHLLIDWRRGEQWFWDCLVDADPANNPANWQWVAGCGADAAPYFRIFNPVSQAERFDPDGAYRTRFIGELAPKGNQGDLFDTAGKDSGNRTYPQPIVDHDFARKRALDAFAAMRGRSYDHVDAD